MRVLLIAPHADDELFGAGGTLLRWKAEGAQIRIQLVTAGDVFMAHAGRVITAEERIEEFVASATALSTERCSVWNLPDGELDQVRMAHLVNSLDAEMRHFDPDVMLIPEPSYHQDHRVVHQACAASLRPTKTRLPSRVLAYEIPTATWVGMQTRFQPTVYVDVSNQMEEKRRILREVYLTQYTETARGALADEGMVHHMQYRGIEAGVGFAEAFQLLREVVR
jgi:LmbE family N-acetylglucosaminyl deacetylase